MNYYNEHDPFAAEWLRKLIRVGIIAPGEVDERSIVDVEPLDLVGYTQCHFFAGIGVWSYALRQAGWRDDEPVWTGSCPCQPFSSAGKGGGFADERHLWPAWFHLIQYAKPRNVPVFGEQVASKDGLAWLDVVHADLEGQGYAVGAVDLCAAGVGAPHIRQRLFFVADPMPAGWAEGRAGAGDGSVAWCERIGRMADASGERRDEQHALLRPEESGRDSSEFSQAAGSRRTDDVGHPDDAGLEGRQLPAERAGELAAGPAGVEPSGMADAADERHERSGGARGWGLGPTDDGAVGRPGPVNGHWGVADWLHCRDDKWRPVEPGTFPLAHGTANRVGRLRGYGNAIVAPVAEAFIRAYRENLPPLPPAIP